MPLNHVQMTIAGNLVRDPEVRVLPSGDTVVNFTVAVTPRVFDNATKEYKDGETGFYDCTAFKQLAENVGASLKKGNRVIVTGLHKTRSWDSQGTKRTAQEILVDEMGPSLQYATATVERRSSSGNGYSNGGGYQSGQAQSEPGDNPFA